MDGQEPQGGGEAPRSSPPWVWAALVALSLVVITAGAIVGMVTTDDDGGEAANASEPGGDSPGAPPALAPTVPALPPTVSVPPLTEEPPVDTGGFGETGSSETGPTVTIPTDTSGSTPPVAGTWPPGQSGYTIVLASVVEAQGRAAADDAASRAATAGLASPGVLRSSDFSSLRPGYWVAYSGVYSTRQDAQAALPQARAAGFATAYPRRVSP